MPARTLVERFRERAARAPDEVIFTWFNARGRDQRSWTNGALAHRAGLIARRLYKEGVCEGEPVLLIYPPGAEIIEALVGCFFAGVIAVPVYPPNPLEPGERLEAITRITERFRIQLALTSARYHRARQVGQVKSAISRAPVWPSLQWVISDKALRGRPLEPLQRRGDEVALWQFTSGSTSAPKGVEITFDNLAHQLTLNAKTLGLSADTRAVIWLPPYHDFGLISGICSALWGNGRLWLGSPLDFIQRPALWFEVMHRVRATHTAAPNFGYALAARKTTPAQRARWDLSCLKCAMTAAEAIRPETTRAFLEIFEGTRFPRAAYASAYGLAEHTVGVTIGDASIHPFSRQALADDGHLRPPEEEEEITELTSCGAALEGVELIIIDPETLRRLPEGRVGEIWVRSGSVARGYQDEPKLTRRVFDAHPLGEENDPPWLRTGDLGALVGGQLFITGRHKEMIIIRGRNLFPPDLEAHIRHGVPGLRPGGIIAAGPTIEGEERLVIFAEPRPGLEGEAARLVEVIRGALPGVTCHAVVIVKGRTLPKTTSGKPRRRVCAEAFERGAWDHDPNTLHITRWGISHTRTSPGAPLSRALPALGSEARRGGLEEAVKEALADLLEIAPERIDLDAPFNASGLDSLQMAGLAHAIGGHTGAPLSLTTLLKLNTPRGLVRWLEEGGSPEGTVTTTLRKPIPATAIQRLIWYDARRWPGSNMTTIACALWGALTPEQIRGALAELIRRHDILRASFHAHPALKGGPELRFSPVIAPRLRVIDAVGWSDEALREAIHAEATTPFRLAEAPLLRVVVYDHGPEERALQLTAHHLIYDGRTLLAWIYELFGLLVLEASGLPSPPRVASKSYEAHARAEAATPPDAEAEAWWQQNLEGAELYTPLSAYPRGESRVLPAPSYTIRGEALEALEARARELGASLNALTLAAWWRALSEITKRDELIISQSFSAEQPDAVSGPVMNLLPLRLCMPEEATPAELIRHAGEVSQAAMAHGEVPFERIIALMGGVDADWGRLGTNLVFNFYDWSALTRFDISTFMSTTPTEFGALEIAEIPAAGVADIRTCDLLASVKLSKRGMRLDVRAHTKRVGEPHGRWLRDRWVALLEMWVDPEAMNAPIKSSS